MDSYIKDDRYIKDETYNKDINNFNNVKTIELKNNEIGIALDHYEDYELPTVSVLTVTYNRDYIFDIAIRNWSKFIYPYNKIEWVILDDSSNVSTIKEKLPNDNRIKYFKLDKKIETIGAKRNRGIELCSNDVICLMDDDDYYFPDSIMNRVKVLLMYNKEIVGSVSLNCVNLIDNTSFITGGGLFTFKNGDKAIICAEATLCFYKSSWEKQKFDEIVKCEEIIDFTRNRVDSFINIHGSYVMVAFSHGNNMSSRALKNQINVYNFLDELDMNTVNFVEDMRLKILMKDKNNQLALEFYKKMINKGLGPYAIYKKLNNLPIGVQKSPIIKELRKQNPLFKVAPIGSVNILYYYYGNNTNILPIKRNNPDIYVLEMYSLASFISNRGYNVTLYLYTDDEFVVENFKVKPCWKYSPTDACETTIIFRELGILNENINTKKLYFFMVDSQIAKNYSIYNKLDEIWVDSIDNKYTLYTNTEYPKDKIHLFSLLDLSNLTEKYSKNKELGAITIFNNLLDAEYDILKKNFNTIYVNNIERIDDKSIKYIDNLYSVNTEYIMIYFSNINLLYTKLINSKICRFNNNSVTGINYDYGGLFLNFLNCGKTNPILDRVFPYTVAGKK